MPSPQLAALIAQMQTERAALTPVLRQVLAGQVPLPAFLDLARQQPIPDTPPGSWQAVAAAGVRGEWITAPGVPGAAPGVASAAPGADGTAVLLYIHGGGWFRGSPAVYREFLVRLSAEAGRPVFAVQYRLAPEAPFPAGLEDCVQAYTWLLDQGFRAGQVAIMGDSAGGNLALAAALKLRDLGRPLPAALACLSAVTDLAVTGETFITKQAVDPTLGGSPIMDLVVPMYLNGGDPRQPLASPLYADLRGLPPLLIQVGSAEVLLDDSRRLAERARAAGVDVTLEVWDDLPHVFQFYPELPEAHQAVERLAAFAGRHLAAPAAP